MKMGFEESREEKMKIERYPFNMEQKTHYRGL
jgi:hypothetical protein